MEHSYVGHSFLCSKCGNIKFAVFDEVHSCPYCGGTIVNLSLTLDEQGQMTKKISCVFLINQWKSMTNLLGNKD